ncbi:MAG: hypothetical protein ABR562_08465 [Thermoplasmatota archaeon]|nr:hypothetical protein [Halobacteriales archaeon]
MASLQSAPPAGFSIIRKATSDPSATVLPFPDGALAALDGAQPSEVSDGMYRLYMSTRYGHMRCDCVVIDFLEPWGQPQDSERPAAESFLSFVRRVVVADEAALEALGGRFMESCEVLESGQESCGVVVAQPLIFSSIAGALDAAQAQPGSLQGDFGASMERKGGGLQVTYEMPVRVLEGSHAGHSYQLQALPNDDARFTHYGGGGERGVNATQMSLALPSFMAVLGRQSPANVTFDFSRGD